MGHISYYICIYFTINHQSSLITQQSSVINHHTIWVPGILGPGALGSRGPEPCGIPGPGAPGALGSQGPEPRDPGAGALGSPGPEPWDPGAWSPGIPGPGALGSRGPAIPFYTFSSRNRSGIGFLSSRIAENDRLGLGSSKIEVLAKNSKKNKGKMMIF